MRALFIGIMSGTSLDGADAVLAEFHDEFDDDAQHRPRVLAHAHAPFPAPLRDELLALQRSGQDELHRAALAANRLVDLHAQLVAALCRESGVAPAAVVAIGSHGQTLRHRPELGYTLQLNAPARLAEATGIAVVSDFRSRDIAAGGQGAPLVPAFHACLFARPGVHRVVVNLGGIANLTDLPADPHATVRGWDCGPGNVLLDGWIAARRSLPFDAGGAWAASGTVSETLLDALLAEPWFALAPPKSTGRELFDMHWLAQYPGMAEMADADVQATLGQLTAAALVASAHGHAPGADEVIVCGGGANNRDLVARIGRTWKHVAKRPIRVMRCDAAEAGGVAPEQVEPLAFAWLARRCIAGQPGNLATVTGAKGPRVLGAITPR